MKFRIAPFVVIIVMLLLLSQQADAQCSMCRTGAESDLNSGGSIAKGLNTGILYLMSVPYIILMAGAYFFFKKPIDARLKSWKDRHFPSRRKA